MSVFINDEEIKKIQEKIKNEKLEKEQLEKGLKEKEERIALLTAENKELKEKVIERDNLIQKFKNKEEKIKDDLSKENERKIRGLTQANNSLKMEIIENLSVIKDNSETISKELLSLIDVQGKKIEKLESEISVLKEKDIKQRQANNRSEKEEVIKEITSNFSRLISNSQKELLSLFQDQNEKFKQNLKVELAEFYNKIESRFNVVIANNQNNQKALENNENNDTIKNCKYQLKDDRGNKKENDGIIGVGKHGQKNYGENADNTNSISMGDDYFGREINKEVDNKSMREIQKEKDKKLFNNINSNQNIIDFEENEKYVNVIHHGIKCEKCKSEIIGIRFKCAVCNNYNLCMNCFGENTFSNFHEHKSFNKIYSSDEKLNKNPYLYDTIYEYSYELLTPNLTFIFSKDQRPPIILKIKNTSNRQFPHDARLKCCKVKTEKLMQIELNEFLGDLKPNNEQEILIVFDKIVGLRPGSYQLILHIEYGDDGERKEIGEHIEINIIKMEENKGSEVRVNVEVIEDNDNGNNIKNLRELAGLNGNLDYTNEMLNVILIKNDQNIQNSFDFITKTKVLFEDIKEKLEGYNDGFPNKLIIKKLIENNNDFDTTFNSLMG